MLKYAVIATGSWANCSVLYDHEHAIVFDTGLPVSAVNKYLFKHESINLEKFKKITVVISHRHTDHGLYVKQWKEHFEYTDNVVINILENDKFKPLPWLDNFNFKNIELFEVKHGKTPNHGISCTHVITGKKIVWFTDCETIGYDWTKKFKGYDIFLVECNWSVWNAPRVCTSIIERVEQEEPLTSKNFDYKNWIFRHSYHLTFEELSNWLLKVIHANSQIVYLHAGDSFEPILKELTENFQKNELKNLPYVKFHYNKWGPNKKPPITLHHDEYFYNLFKEDGYD